MARAMRWRTALILAFDVETAALTGGEELPGPHVGRQVLDAAQPRVVPVVLLIGCRAVLDRLDGLDGQAEPGGHGLARGAELPAPVGKGGLFGFVHRSSL